MQISKSNSVSFGTNIVFRCGDEFKNLTKTVKDSIDSPWTAEQIKRATKIFTEGVVDCTGGGIIVKNDKKNCFDMVMFHLDPQNRDNYDISKIKETLIKKLDGNKPLSAIIFGCKKSFSYSVKMFDKIEAFIKNLNIPYTKLKDSGQGYVSGLYNGVKDEFTLYSTEAARIHRNEGTLTKKDLPSLFGEIKLSPKDTLSIDQFPGCKMDVTDAEWKYFLAHS